LLFTELLLRQQRSQYLRLHRPIE